MRLRRNFTWTLYSSPPHLKFFGTPLDAHVFKGLLRFIYTGQTDSTLLEDHAEALYCAADKYNVEDLLLICETHLLKNVRVENALVMYDLAQRHPDSLLSKKSSEIIAR